MNLKEIFKDLCLAKITFKEVISKYSLPKHQADVKFLKGCIRITNTCGHCNTRIDEKDFDYYVGYWTPFMWKPVHKHCKQEASKDEAYECQKIDMNCNDCVFFTRLKGNNGLCTKKNTPIIAHSNNCQPENTNCFVHRKNDNT